MEGGGGANKVHEKREAKGRAFRVQAMKEKRTEITLRFGRRHIDDTLSRGLSPQAVSASCSCGPHVRSNVISLLRVLCCLKDGIVVQSCGCLRSEDAAEDY